MTAASDTAPWPELGASRPAVRLRPGPREPLTGVDNISTLSGNW